jgi:hypothetical protein
MKRVVLVACASKKLGRWRFRWDTSTRRTTSTRNSIERFQIGAERSRRSTNEVTAPPGVTEGSSQTVMPAG